MYTKTDWRNDGGQIGGDAALTNMENGIETANVVGGWTKGSDSGRHSLTSYLNFSTNTAGAAVAKGLFNYEIGLGSDTKFFDPRDCGIFQFEYYTTVSGVPINPTSRIIDDTRSSARYITMEYCGRKHADISTLTVANNTADLDVTLPEHGFPLTLEGGNIYLSTGGLTNNTEDFSYSISSFLVVDADTIKLIGFNEIAWDALIASTTYPVNMYFKQVVFVNAGGQDYSFGGTATLNIYWKANSNSATFAESISSDN